MEKYSLTAIVIIAITVLFSVWMCGNVELARINAVENTVVAYQNTTKIIHQTEYKLRVIQPVHITDEADTYLDKISETYPEIRQFEVEGMSMQPTFFSGNVVLMKECGEDEITEGDIIAAYYENMTIVHRVIGIYEDYILTQGDANDDYTEEVLKGNVRGKVIGVIYK